MPLSNHDALADPDFQFSRNLSQDAPFNDQVTYRIFLSGTTPRTDEVGDVIYLRHPNSEQAVSEAGVGSAGDVVTDLVGNILLLRRTGEVVAVRVVAVPDDAEDTVSGVEDGYAVTVEDIGVLEGLEAPENVNVLVQYSSFNTIYSAFSPLRASMVGVNGELAVYSETIAPSPGNTAPADDSDFQVTGFTLTYYGAVEVEKPPVGTPSDNTEILTIGARTRRVKFSAT